MLLSIKKRKALSNLEKDTEEPQMHITKWKKPVWIGYILYDSNYMTFWKRHNDGHS